MKVPVNILIVDDDLGMLKTLNYILSDKGYNVDTSASASDAIDQIKKKIFDLVLTDYKMPDMNGLDLLKKIKKISSRTETVLMTAYTLTELTDKAKQAGVLAVLHKPLDLDKLIALTRHL